MCNLGKLDRIIRAVLGVVLIGIGIYMGMWIVTGLGVIALATAAISFCPLYAILKLNSGCNPKA